MGGRIYGKGKCMEYIVSDMPIVTTKDEVRQQAIDWQIWASEQSMSYGELAEWQGYFGNLAHKFGLVKEFKENGII